jgi:hypothetical protein
LPVLDNVTVNYLPKNVAPEVDEVTVVAGARVPGGTRSDSSNSTSGFEPPTPTVKDKNSIAVRWKAHDDNGDTLVYDVYYRGDGETRWKLVRSGIYDRYVNLDSDMFPDGGYRIRIVASDSPTRAAEDTLRGDATSARFEVDNMPPRIEALSAKVEGGNLRVTFRAVDGFSVIDQAEYSIDGGDWQEIEPVGQISDSKTESYDFTIPIPVNTAGDSSVPQPASSAGEHTIAVRAYDRFDNLGIGKVTVNVPGR